MNNATPNYKHMKLDVFMKALDFQLKYGGPFCIITGGEPTEHPLFAYFIRIAMAKLERCYVTVTTNGLWMQDHEDFIAKMHSVYGNHLMFQVTNDERYYPVRIDWTRSVFQLENVIVCDKVNYIYPQGRALDNNLEWDSKASKCFNVRAIANQIDFKDLAMVISMLAVKGKFCTPHISIDGHIKLGESDLCPNCSHIDKSNSEIMNDIINFRCDGCKMINDKLDFTYKKVIGEA
jgi:hypothetical protein